ncbi:MAG: chemotaxis protein CheW [Clostridiales bacterium]
MIQNEDFINEFIEEARTHMDIIESTLLKKETIRNKSDSINEIFRAVHSIKGTASFFGLKKIVSLSHMMENIFGEIRNHTINLSSKIADTMILANDKLEELIDNVLDSEKFDISDIELKLKIILENESKDKIDNEYILEDIIGNKYIFSAAEYDIIMEGINFGHKVYELKLCMNKDLNSNSQSPIKLIKKIQKIGMIVSVSVDHSEISTLDDILEAVKKEGNKDLYLKIIITSILEIKLLTEAVNLDLDKFKEIKVKNENEPDTLDSTSEKDLTNNNIVDNNDLLKNDNSKKYDHIKKESNSKENIIKSEKIKNLKSDDSIRVSVSVLNDLLNMASEMVLGRNQLLRKLEGYRKSISGLSPILSNIDRLTSGMQEKIMQTRMQPVSNVFNKFPRLIRDLSKSINKRIDLEIEGGSVELDKAVIESLNDPLTHLIRNSADHGLEFGDERKKVGKEEIGKIKLKAYHEGGYVYIDIADDGRGIDINKVIEKSLEKNIITNEKLKKMTEKEIIQLIFRPGFSTTKSVSNISGRGVGMDVVKSNIEKLGGTVEVFTKMNLGTTIRLMLPLTLAIIQSLIVEINGHKFALPQANLKEIVRIKVGDSKRHIEYLHDSEVLRLRGRLLPIFHLSDILEIDRKYIDPIMMKEKIDRRVNLTDIREKEDDNEVKSRRNDENSVIRILVLQIGLKLFGVAVDTISASEETLVKPLPKFFKECGCYSGVTIMGDGKAAMILDVEGIMKLSSFKFNIDIDEQSKKLINDRDNLTETQNLLLFKCSGNEIYSIDLSMISRVEEIDLKHIEKIGDKEYIKHENTKLRIIYPEDYLPVNSGKHSDKRYILIPKHVKYPIGISVEKIIDNINIKLDLNKDDKKIHGLLGTTIYESKIVLILNIYELFELADPEFYSKDSLEYGKGKILLVEDTPFFQKQEREYLESSGFEVVLTSNGKEALTVLEKEKFDCVISDIQMPLMDGIELIKKIRENNKISNLPAIALTSMSTEKQKKIGLDSGFDYYEIKLDRDNLIKTINRALKETVKI